MKINNVTGHDHCAACADDGWVELTQQRGVTTCKWCDMGVKRYVRSTERDDGERWMPMMDYDGTDIEPRGLDHGAVFLPDAEFLRKREAAGCNQDALKAMFPRSIWPQEWSQTAPGPPLHAMPSLRGEELAKRKQAEIELDRLQSQKQAVSNASSDHAEPPQVLQPAGFDDDDLPF